MMLDTAKAIGEYAVGRTQRELNTLSLLSESKWCRHLDPAERAAWGVIFVHGVDGPMNRQWKPIVAQAREGLLSPANPFESWSATLNAMLATYTRDHIGQHGYTQAHYDLLMEPWVEWVEEMEK